jgi:hypothetical protein
MEERKLFLDKDFVTSFFHPRPFYVFKKQSDKKQTFEGESFYRRNASESGDY